MSFNRPIVFWIAVLVAFVAAVAVLREVLLPFVAGIVLAYLLNPLANRLERVGMNRLVGTLLIVSFLFVLIVCAFLLTVPVIVREIADFVENFPRYVSRLQELANDPARPWVKKLFGEGLAEAQQSFGELTSLATGWLGAFLHSAWSGGRALISIISIGIVAPIVGIYLTYDWNRMIAWIDNSVPPAQRETVRALARQIDSTIGGFVRGQSVLCLVLAVYYATTLAVLGLKHGALIGFAAGLLSFIPYVGFLFGALLATSVAIAQFWPNWVSILIVPAIFFIGQAIADYVLSPYLVGRRVHLNAVWVMFALFAFGYLFGFIGLLIAVPLAAAIGVLVRFALRQYYASPLYTPAGQQ
jgi:predicted PurR-regulated permease PerM